MSPPAVVTGAAPSSFDISSQAPAVRSFRPFRSSSVFTGLRECTKTSAVRMNSGKEMTPSAPSRNSRCSSTPPPS